MKIADVCASHCAHWYSTKQFW